MTVEQLEMVSGQVLAPLSGEVGKNLVEEGSPALIQIRNQFNDPSKDFRKLLDLGQEILSNQSKDLWALWALVSGLLWSKQYDPAHSFVFSSKIVHEFCRKYWKECYPDSLGLRNTLLANIVKSWRNYLERFSEQADDQLLSKARDEIAGLDTFLRQEISGDAQEQLRRLPCLGGLAEISRLLSARTSQTSPPSPASGNGAKTTPYEPSTGTVNLDRLLESSASSSAGATAPPVVALRPLETEYERALAMIANGQTDQGLESFTQALARCGEFAEQFRGQVLLGELYLKASLPTHAKRVMQHCHERIKEITLPLWDPKLCSRLWSGLITAHRTIESEEKPDKKLLADLFSQICRIDPKTAATLPPLRDN